MTTEQDGVVVKVEMSVVNNTLALTATLLQETYLLFVMLGMWLTNIAILSVTKIHMRQT